jgi:prepilin-type N-terminal cleavage/methylation domain-containing protein
VKKNAMNQRHSRGFGLIELLVALVVVSILASIALPVYLTQRDKAKEAALKENKHLVTVRLASHLHDDLNITYRASDNRNANAAANATKYVSNALEVGLENGAQGSNVDNIVNPYSAKKTIINATSPNTSATLSPAAVFITNSSTYRWATNTTNTWLAGTIIVCWNTSNATIEVYQMGRAGKRVAGTLLVSPTK